MTSAKAHCQLSRISIFINRMKEKQNCVTSMDNGSAFALSHWFQEYTLISHWDRLWF